MSIEFVFTILVQVVIFAFLFGRQAEAIKILSKRSEKFDADIAMIARALQSHTEAFAQHLGEHAARGRK